MKRFRQEFQQLNNILFYFYCTIGEHDEDEMMMMMMFELFIDLFFFKVITDLY